MLNLALVAALLISQAAPAQVAAPAADPMAAKQPEEAAQNRPATQILQDLFPPATGPMTLVVGDAENPLTYRSLVRQYGELTGQFFVVKEGTGGMLGRALNLDRTMTVPVEEVQSVFERLLRHGEFALKPVTTSGARIIELTSLATSARGNLRANSIYLSSDELHLAGQHPALLMTAVVTLPHVDVRQLSNSLRTMITDANTQQLLPAGNSNSMVIMGFGDQIAGMVGTLQAMDAAAAAGAQDQIEVTEFIELQNADAINVTAMLNSVYAKPEESAGLPGPKFIADSRANLILISTRAGKLAGIKKLIAALDVKKGA